MNASVQEKVREIIKEQLGLTDNEIGNDASFIEDLGADSLDIVELIMAMEEEFDLEIPDDDAERIVKVQDAIDYIERRAQ